MDLATVIGIITGFSLVMITIFMGGSPQIFIDIPSMMIAVSYTHLTLPTKA